MTEIPPPFAHCQELLHRKESLAEALRKLEVGQYKKFSLERRKSIFSAANYAGIKIATRQMGSSTTFRCYRTE